jgi:plastocyanin
MPRFLAAVAVSALAAIGLVACGDDEDEQSLAITLGQNGEFTLPSSAEAGVAEITVTNNSDEDADAQLIRVEGNRDPEDVIAGVGAAVEGKPFPDWFFAGGGTSTARPGESETVTEILEPGTYYVFNTNANRPPDPASVNTMEVSGEESDAELPETDASITAVDYGFETEGDLTAGANEITFENTGAQPHHIIASRLKEGATIEQAEEFLKAGPRGQGPFTPGPSSSDSTAVLEGGRGQNVTLQLREPGTYALYCFITDRQGGPPHVIRGMVDEVEVQ